MIDRWTVKLDAAKAADAISFFYGVVYLKFENKSTARAALIRLP